jgi:hypothetical protein
MGRVAVYNEDEISSDEGEEDNLSESDHNSQTEQEISDDENERENVDAFDEDLFYKGNDETTKWFKRPD